MAQPSDVPRWNTDGTNRVDPPSGQKDSGWLVSQAPPSSYFNWWMNLVYAWVLYLKDLATEAFTWTAAHVFQKGIVVTNSTAGSDPNNTSLGAGVVGTGNNFGSGVKGIGGGGAGSAGVEGVAATSGYGVKGQGAGLGNGGYFVGGPGIGGAGVGGGLEAYAGGDTSKNGFGLYAMGGGNVAGVRGLGGAHATATGPGVRGQGAGGGSVGVQGEGSVNSAGVNGIGAGTGAGVTGTGGVGGGHGATFTGGNNGGSGSYGNGVVATGASPGTGVPGVGGVGGVFTGGLNSPGATVQGGVGQTAGLVATGGAVSGLSGPGVIANNAVSTAGTAIVSNGTIDMNGSSTQGPTAGLLNRITKLTIPKSIGVIELNNTNTPTVSWGQNIASVAQAVGGDITVTFQTPMITDEYWIDANLMISPVGGSPPAALIFVLVISRSNTGFVVRPVTYNGVPVNRNDTQHEQLGFSVYGPQ